jgi:hypothetical protein
MSNKSREKQSTEKNNSDNNAKVRASNIIELEDNLASLSAKQKKTRRSYSAKNAQIGSRKGIETMFRSAYRAQLDLITLAATKANIMISLNGFIASLLMISGAFIYTTAPVFLPPAIIFLVTSAISIYYALWAASPASAPDRAGFFRWVRNFLSGKAAFMDYRKCLDTGPREFVDGESNILVFEDFARLSREDYLERMRLLISDQSKVYDTMSDQLYWLGIIADKKFRMLRSSYAVFRWGIILSIFMFLIVKAFPYLFTPPANADTTSLQASFGLSKFEHIYEPSGVEQLPDGRLVIVEDESSRGLRIARLRGDGSILVDRIPDENLADAFRNMPNDLEGVSIDNDGYIYAITSHSRSNKGKAKLDREQLIRFRIEGNELVDHAKFHGLRDYIEESGLFDRAVFQNGKELDINIEALSFDREGQRLLIGFRKPQIDGKSVIAVLENPKGIFENGEKPRLGEELILLNLAGGGLRSLVYDHNLGGYLLANEVKLEGGKWYSRIWYWNGSAEYSPKLIDLPGMINIANLEGITPVTFGSKSGVLVTSDDGDARKKSPAHYLLLDYNQLSIRN